MSKEVKRVKELLIELEKELRVIRASRAKREEYRELDASDIGYISSLLTMLTEETTFKRWLDFTTYRYNHFRRERK